MTTNGSTANSQQIRQFITNEFFNALKLSRHNPLRFILKPLVKIPTSRFARLAAQFDQRAARYSIPSAMSWFLAHYIDPPLVQGSENIPQQGPLLFASNHPGAYDGVCIVANCRREDIHIVVSDVPFTHAFPAISEQLIYVSPGAHGRMAALRSMIRILQQGKAILIFPSGYVDPDPDLQPGSEQALHTWSPSLELALRRVPDTNFVPIIVSGVLAESCLRNPLTLLAKKEWEKRKLAEFLQISQQLVFNKRFSLEPRISFGYPTTLEQLIKKKPSAELMEAIIEHAKSVLIAHTSPHRLNPMYLH